MPVTRVRTAQTPLFSFATRMRVGSPTITAAGFGNILHAAAIIAGAPKHPTSSSYENMRCTGRSNLEVVHLGTRDNTAAIKPFMSHAPRACRREPRAVRLKGSLVQL